MDFRRSMRQRLLDVPGIDGLSKLGLVYKETFRTIVNRDLLNPLPPVPDAVVPDDIPSVAELGLVNRTLAEIDQDGFAFAVHEADVGFFNRRPKRFPKLRYELEVVIHNGFVCVRKCFRRQATFGPLAPRLWSLAGLFFCTEAAALLRLRDSSYVPRIRDIELSTRTLFMDYIRGQTLQHKIADHGKQVLDIDLAPAGQLFDPSRDDREIEAFASIAGDTYRERIEQMIRAINSRGVAPLDVKLGNVIVGGKTGSLYWIDFERAALDSFPSYDRYLAEHHRLVDAWFGLSLSQKP